MAERSVPDLRADIGEVTVSYRHLPLFVGPGRVCGCGARHEAEVTHRAPECNRTNVRLRGVGDEKPRDRARDTRSESSSESDLVRARAVGIGGGIAEEDAGEDPPRSPVHGEVPVSNGYRAITRETEGKVERGAGGQQVRRDDRLS